MNKNLITILIKIKKYTGNPMGPLGPELPCGPGSPGKPGGPLNDDEYIGAV